MLIISALGRLRKEDFKFEDSLSYIVRPSLVHQKKKKKCKTHTHTTKGYFIQNMKTCTGQIRSFLM